jgi:hypothetical protein
MMNTWAGPDRRRCWLLAAVVLLLVALACGPTGGGVYSSTQAPAPTATEEEVAEGSPETEQVEEQAEEETTEPTEEPTEEPSSEQPLPTITPTSCSHDARFVSDVTVPDGQLFAPNTPFTKTWELESTGCVAWPNGTRLVFDSGDQMGGPSGVDVISAVPGQKVHVGVDLTAPGSPGVYQAYWQLEAGGVRFGQRIFVKIEVVPLAPTDEPTPTDEPPPPSGAPDLVIAGVTSQPPLILDNLPMTVRVVVKNQGNAAAPASNLGFEWVNAGAAGMSAVNALNPGASQVVNLGFTLDTGAYTLRLTADIEDVVGESDEGNNGHDRAVAVHDYYTYSTKGLTIQGNQSIELDEGILYASLTKPTIDFVWYTSTGGGGIVQYWLMPRNGAKFAVYGPGTPGIVDCMTASLSTGNINGGQYVSSTHTYTPAAMPVGTYVCYQTSSGRYGEFRVNALDDYGNALRLGYTTWHIN